MFKMIFLALGLAIGFGGGVYWATKHPDAATKLSAEEERRFLEAQMQITQKIQSKLDQLSSKASNKVTGSGNSFLSSSQSGGGDAAVASKADVNELKADAQKQ